MDVNLQEIKRELDETLKQMQDFRIRGSGVSGNFFDGFKIDPTANIETPPAGDGGPPA